jgi:hypothetical protein
MPLGLSDSVFHGRDNAKYIMLFAPRRLPYLEYSHLTCYTEKRKTRREGRRIANLHHQVMGEMEVGDKCHDSK